MMRTDNLKITFNTATPIENRALRSMSLSIDEGEFVAVIGIKVPPPADCVYNAVLF